MKVLLTTLNAKYIHSSLALRYLEKYCDSPAYDIVVEEYTINDTIDSITANIYRLEADVIAFSCYIWNITMILEIADRLKKIKPECTLILGGPEVSYDAETVLSCHDFIDFIVVGEGEETLKELLQNLIFNDETLDRLKGIVYKSGNGNIVMNQSRPLICELDEIPAPYNEQDLERLSGKLIYYETSRGCPFNCSYCLSSTIHGVRYFSMDRIKSDLLLLIRKGVRLVKFVDRTFNCNRQRTLDLFKFLLDYHGQTSFHFEVAADLFDDEVIQLLSIVPKGVFQFEIGVQSTNQDTIHAIDRRINFEELAVNVAKIRKADNINLHLDLIAGLPEEDYRSFSQSFDDVYGLMPHVLQLGFLKLLKGAKIRERAAEYGYKFTGLPPYEILESKWLEYGEILKFKGLEDVLEKYHNSGAFEKSLRYILDKYYKSSFGFFEDLAKYFQEKGLDRLSHSRKALYDILYEFYQQEIRENLDCFIQYLKFDLIFHQKGVQLPYWADKNEKSGFKEKCFEFLKSEEHIKKYLPQYIGMPAKKVIKEVAFEPFVIDVLAEEKDIEKVNSVVILFDYSNLKAYPLRQF
ncbi:MAG: B12-binding domain-containing radical SAM protein [Clostridia bacterium]